MTIKNFFAPGAWGLGGASETRATVSAVGTSAVRRAAMTLLVMLLTTMTAWAQLSNLTYNSAGGFYEIWSVADLQAMANYYNGFNGGDGKVFKMMQDIDLAGVNPSFLPIASANSENLFNDVFDGNDHKITGLSLVRDGGKTYYGLFQQLGSSATVKNLTLVDCDVRYTGGINGTSVGAIAGRNRGTIQNCTVIGTVSNHDNEHCVGAIVGENISPGRVENCNAVAGQPVTGVLYSTSTPGTESGNHLYYRLLTTSAVSLTTTPAATTVAGTACYVANTVLALTVTPNDGTQMLTDVSFTGTTATKTAYGQYTLTMPARDVSVTAALAAKISVSATGGTVTPNTYSPAVGSQVTLTLAPNTGYALTTIAATAGGTALTLNGSGLTRTFTMPDKPVSITATFSAVSYTVSGLGSKTGGRISGPGKAHYGDEVTLTAAPTTGYSLQTLSVTTAGNQNVALSGSGNTRTFTMPAENVTVSATFALAQLTVHVTAYNCTATATPNPATMGQTVTVSITPDAGATLQSVTVRDADWNHLTVSGSGQTRTFTMSAADAYVTVACSSSGQLAGKGTQDEPYLIFNEADLRLLSSLSKTTTFGGTNFRLERDITMSDTPMLPIGNSSNGQFDGHFDGNGHTISNLHISGKVADLVALFGINFGSVSNLTLASCAITGNESGTFQIGAIVGYNIGTVSNCHVNSGTISATAAKVVGGIVSYNDGGTISGCTNGATVSQTARTVQIKVGGIVGNISSGTVKDCTNTGSVSGAGASGSPSCYCGGIAGYLYGGILSGCANTGSVSLTGSNVSNNDAGGVAGYIENRDAAICIGNTNGGAVSAANGNKNYAGGIVGYYFYSSYILKNNYYFGACTAKGSASYVGSGDAPQSDVTDNYGAVPGYAITKPAEVTLSSIEGYADVAHPAYAASGETVTFTVTVPEGYTATVKYNDGSDHALTATNGVYSFTMPAKAVTITVNFAPDPAHFSQSGTTYTIHTAAGWDVFCDALQDNDTYNRFSGKTVKLGADISVSRMAGGDYHDFLGIFDGGTIDGDRHKLTFTAEAKDSYLAPFSNVLGSSDTDHAVIRNLKVESNITANDYRHMAGLIAKVWGYVDVINCDVTVNINSTKGSTNTDLYPAGIASQVVSGAQLTVSDCTVGGKISTDGKYAGGIIGIVQGSAGITNSVSSVTIDSSTDGDGTHGGLVGVQGNNDGSTINIDGCVFNGELLGSSTTCCGGFVGWRSKTVNISNSLFAPAQVGINTTEGNTPCATFVRNGNSTPTNSYYTTTLGTAQGKQARSITADVNVTIEATALTGTETEYTVSGITAYSGGGLALDNGATLYYGSGDNVSLTLSHGDREGYTFQGYTASAGTLSGDANLYTLTMPDENVTLYAQWAPDPAHFAVNGDGSYTIKTADGWGVFCDALQDNTTYNRFSGKTVYLDKDITVTRMAGSESKPFCGHFDGQNNTLTFTYDTDLVNDPILDYKAPFRYVMGGIGNASHHATISNLNVDSHIVGEKHLAGLIANQKGLVDVTNCHVQAYLTCTDRTDSYCAGLVSHADLTENGNLYYYGNENDGTLTISGCTVSGYITTYSKYAGGFVGMAEGKTSIENSVSGVTINSFVSGNGTHGGFIGLQQNTMNYADVKTTIEGCLFNGKLINSNEVTTQCGGFIGWHDGGELEIKHCLYAPANLDSYETEISDGSTFVGNGTVGSNCIYTRALGTPQGKATRSIAAGEYVTISDIALKSMGSLDLSYSVSGIHSYGYGGISCGGNLYYGSGDQVSLVLSNDYTPAAPAGSVYGYTATGGTLEGTANPYTLTMPDADVTINVDTENTITLDWGGTGTEDDPYMIYNKEQLDLVASRMYQNGYTYGSGQDYEGHPDGYFFKLGADIVYPYTSSTENNFTPIGNGYPYPSFQGTFDGDGHTISGIRINAVYFYSNDYYFDSFGLFGEVAGTVKNVILADAVITGSSNIGGIVGNNYYGTLENNLVIGATISATDDNSHGAICGENCGTLERNYYHGCTVADEENATGVGCGFISDDDEEDYITADITDDDGAVPMPALSDNGDNADDIDALANRGEQGLPTSYPVVLEGRTLSKSGEWNTLCLPFDVEDGDLSDGLSFTGTPLEGATVKELNAATSNLTNGTLTLNFTDASSIKAGKPYIVRWGTPEDNPGGTIVDPVFEGVTISSTAPTAVTFTGGSFVGQYSPFRITAGNIDEIILLSTGNRLGYSQNPRTLHSFRAHFEIPTSGGVREFVLNFDDENTTGILSPAEIKEITEMAGAWYSIDGRKLDTKPTAKGVYIRGGKKVIIK